MSAQWQRNGITNEQIAVLLSEIKAHRILRDDQGFAYLPQWDVRAMLTRVFGFGGWSEQAIVPTHLQYETTDVKLRDGSDAVEVCYVAHRRLIIHHPDGGTICSHDGTSSGTMKMGIKARGKAHDSALKDADSGALKRAAINLGDQFGLGLYNDGKLDPLVKRLVLDPPDEHTQETT